MENHKVKRNIMKNNLEGMEVKIIPDANVKSINAKIIMVNYPEVEKVIVKVSEGFDYDGRYCEYFLASTRHVGKDFLEILKGESLLCSFIRIGEDNLNADDPFDSSWWRGGAAFVGDMLKREGA